jgi:hypothetical protein
MPKTTTVQSCATPSCNNNAKNCKYCSTCRARKSRSNDPVKAAYVNLRSHATARGKKFSLTLQGFIDAIAGTEYLTKRGRGKFDLSIDRIVEEVDEYFDGGIQVLPNFENVRKRHKNLKGWGVPSLAKTEDDPF